MLSFCRPSKQTFEAFYNNFHNHDDDAGPLPTLLGHGASVYDDRDDLMALQRHPKEDRLTKFLREGCPFLFRVSKASVFFAFS
jgi:hypothetical protein